MHLSVTCPRCQSKYQLDPGMRGKRMRCPNTICRAVFEVRDDSDPAVATPTESQAKEAPPPPVAPPKPVEAKKPKPVPAPKSDFPDDFPGDDDAVAAPTSAIATEAWQPDPAPSPLESVSVEPAPRRRHVALWIIAAMLLVFGAGAAVGLWRIRSTIESNETERFQKAEELYKEENFADASVALQKLQRDFPDSPHLKKYRFLAELSDVRQAAYARESSEETVKALERIVQLAGVYQGDPLLKEREGDLWRTLDFVAVQLTRFADSEKAPALLSFSRRAWERAVKYPPPAGAGPAERARKHEEDWKRVEAVLADHFERQHVIAVLKKSSERATASAVEEAWKLVEKTKRQEDAEIRALLEQLFKAHREHVKFVPADDQDKTPIPAEDRLASLCVTPSLQAGRVANLRGAPILAMARGVLYALDPTDGELRWARRVGVDTCVLPLRVKADAITPELLLVLSSDQRTLSAVIAATGETFWQTPLSDACLGTPVLVEQRVLVPTLAGRIEEIEIAEGRRLGAYHVGQRLTMGGVHQPGSSFVYFPADDFCLYAIDIRERFCTNILYTRHRAGSLRGLPVIASKEKAGWLLWTEATGPGTTTLRPYALPIVRHDQKPVAPILQLPALSAGPWQDADRLVVLSETGLLSVWGLRQKGTRDPLLFPMLQSDFPVLATKNPGRCEVVFADSETIWTIAHGRLQRVEIGFQPSRGPNLSARWTQPIALGNLLHAADVRRQGDQPVLFLTTQADDRATCRCSAVDGVTGKILWQRQLGIFPQEPPRLVGGQIVLAGAEGLLRFSPAPASADGRLRTAGEWLVQESPSWTRRLLLTSDSDFVQIARMAGGTNLKIDIGPVAGEGKIRTLEVDPKATLQGVPALGDGFLLLPLANGILVRVNLADGSFLNGPEWRAVGAEEDTRGYVAALGVADFLVTDGSRGVARLASADGKTWDKRATAQLAHRITAPPAILAGKVCLLDASDTLTLLDTSRLIDLKRWTMPGKVSAGPFVRAGQVGVVVGKNRLVWLDPHQEAPAWEYAFVADIVGEPHLIDGVLVVGDVGGHFVALDPGSGRPLGAGLTLKANVAPTAAPLPFGAGQAFVPMSDGTIVILPLDKLRLP